MKTVLIGAAMLFFAKMAVAQTPADSVKAAVSKLFTAMYNGDGAGVKNSFADGAILQTIIKGAEAQPRVQTDSVAEFADFISKAAKGDANEVITFDVVKTDGPLAIVWTPYKFYYKGQFSHCGVNSFQLIRINGQWKIQYIIDTRRKQGCE